jgi:hypothetical protein
VYYGAGARVWQPSASGGAGSEAACYTRFRAMNCAVCGRSDQEISLYKCPICFKHICDDCSNRAFGRVFCSKMCADQFFFGDDDE